MIYDENNVLTDDELVVVRDFLKKLKHGCLYIRNEHPRGFKVLGLHKKIFHVILKGWGTAQHFYVNF